MVDYKRLSDPEYRREYEERKAVLAAEIAKEEASYAELVKDAVASPKLNDWESNFIHNLLNSMRIGAITRLADLSDKQREVLKKIERKIYAVG